MCKQHVVAKVQLYTSLTQAVGKCALCHFLAALTVGKEF
jgi:hypothetical protein